MPEPQRRKKTEEIARIKDNGEGMKEDYVKREEHNWYQEDRKTKISRKGWEHTNTSAMAREMEIGIWERTTMWKRVKKK